MKNFTKTILILVFLLFSNFAFSQNSSLNIFEPFIGQNWTGHYVNSEDSALVHNISWEYCLESNYVKQTKYVPEVGFKMETYFYWDYENKQISTLCLLNKAMYSKGSAQINEGKLEINYKTFFTEGFSNSKQTFEITKNGNLKDCFYRKKSDKWIQGHLIIYEK